MTFELSDLSRLLPEMMLIVMGIMIVITDVMERWASDRAALVERTKASAQMTAIVLVVVLAAALVQSGYLFVLPESASTGWTSFFYNIQRGGPGGQPILGALATDHLTQIARLVFVGAALLVVLVSMGRPVRENPGEFYGLILISTAGMCLMAGAQELILAFIALELASIPQYILAGQQRASNRSPESGLKYFLFGVFSSAILLYGMSLAYGLTASAGLVQGDGAPAIATLYTTIAQASAGGASPLLMLALVFIVGGVGYKIAAVPFHSYAPDVYEGAPGVVTAFIATASKTAGFLMLYRMLTAAFPGAAGGLAPLGGWSALLLVVALATVVFGNLAALPQQNAKRLLAYSSIGHAGFILLAMLLWSSSAYGAKEFSLQALLYYLIAYTLTNIGAFGALAAIHDAVGGDNLSDLDGLARRNMPMALLLTVFVLSLAGIPPLAGFWGKFFVFMAGYQAGAFWLVAIAVAMTVVALAYYLRMLKVIWFNPPAVDEPMPMPRVVSLSLALTMVLMLAMGLLPNVLWGVLARAAQVAGL